MNVEGGCWFVVKVFDVCVGCAASGYSEGCVLNFWSFSVLVAEVMEDQMVLAYSNVGRVTAL